MGKSFIASVTELTNYSAFNHEILAVLTLSEIVLFKTAQTLCVSTF